MVIINGTKIEAAGISVSKYLLDAGYSLKTIAVEINEEILPKKDYSDTFLKDGDIVEVVNFVGGG